MKSINIKLPDTGIYRRLKIACLDRNVTITSFVIMAIEEALKNIEGNNGDE